MKLVSVIIVTYNSEKDIFDCVQSIEDCADIPKQDIELIIVDNCSRAPQLMFERLRRQWGEDIICIENTRNGGYGQGNNVGIRRATAPVILIVNPDVRLQTPFFKKPIAAFDTYKKLFMYGAKQMLTPTRPSTNSFWGTIYMNGYLRTILTAICVRRNWFIPRCMYLSGSCFFIRKSSFEQIGFFDEDVFMYGEESDIHYRLTRTFGPHIQYDPTMRYLHFSANRKPNFQYEKELLEVDLFHHQKKGLPIHQCLNNYLRINNLLLGRAYLRKWFHRNFNALDFEVLKQMRNIILTKQHES